MRSRGIVYVDETVGAYEGIRLPANWALHAEPKWGSLGASMRWCLAQYPDATQYGWLADDTVPRTHGWDRELEEAAGDWGLSYAADLWFSEDDYWASQLELGTHLSSGLCWGGDLVRTVGWWAPPGLRQAGIDTAWTAIVSELGLARYTPDVIVEHKNWRTGKRPADAGDEWTRDGEDYIRRDIETRDRLVVSPEFRAALERVKAAIS